MPCLSLEKNCKHFLSGMLLTSVLTAAVTCDNEIYTCSQVNELAPSARCAYVKQNCASAGYIPWPEWYYCNLGHQPVKQRLMQAGLCAVLILIFRVIDSTASHFLSPTLTQISKDFGLPPRLAGATLLALGNGAPDLSSSIQAIRHDSYKLAISAQISAGKFVTCVVAGTVLVMNHAAMPTPFPFYRDVLLHMVAVLTVLGIFKSGKVTRRSVAAFYSIYGVYVSMVVFADAYAALKRRWQAAHQQNMILPVPSSSNDLSARPQLVPTTATSLAHSPQQSMKQPEAAQGLVRHHVQDAQSLGEEQLDVWAAACAPSMLSVHATAASAGVISLLGPVATNRCVVSDGGRSDDVIIKSATAKNKAMPLLAVDQQDEDEHLFGDGAQPEHRAGLPKAANMVVLNLQPRDARLRRTRAGSRDGDRSTVAISGHRPPTAYPPVEHPSSTGTCRITAASDTTQLLSENSSILPMSGSLGCVTVAELPADGSAPMAVAELLVSSHAGSVGSSKRGSYCGGRKSGREGCEAAQPDNPRRGLTQSSITGGLGGRWQRSLDETRARTNSLVVPTMTFLHNVSTNPGLVKDPNAVDYIVEKHRHSNVLPVEQLRLELKRVAWSQRIASLPGVSTVWPLLKQLFKAVGSVFWWLELPLTVARKLTIPLVQKDVYDRGCFVVAMYFAPLFAATTLKRTTPLLIAAAVSGVVCGTITLITTSDCRHQAPKWKLGTRFPLGAAIVALYGFLISLVWIQITSTELVALLQTFGTVYGLQTPVLGLTLLAWGNSIGDLVTNAAMARRGLAQMAMTACFAGSTFNLMVGSATGFLVHLTENSQSFHQVELDNAVITGIAADTVNVGLLVAVSLLFGLKLPWRLGYAMWVVYIVYLAVALVYAVQAGSK